MADRTPEAEVIPWARALPERVAATMLLGVAAFAYRGFLAYPDLPQFEYTAGFWLLQPGSTWPALGVAGAVWLWMRRSERLDALPTVGAPALAAPLLVFALACAIWGNAYGATAILVLSLAALALGIAALRRGAAGCRTVLLPVAFLAFAVPTPPPLINAVVWELQLWTAQLSGALVTAFGTPALVETLIVSRPGHEFIVIESCTGWRVAEILTAVAVLLREANPGSTFRSWLPVILAPFVAAALNIARIATIVLAPDPYAMGDHTIQALVLVTVGIPLLVAITLALRPRAPKPDRNGFPRSAIASALTVAVLGALLLALFPEPWREAGDSKPRFRFPLENAGWTAETLEPDTTFLGNVRFDAMFEREYTREGEAVQLFVGVEDGAVGRSSTRSPKTLLPGSGWHLETVSRESLEGASREVDRAIVTNGTVRALVLHWRTRDEGLAGETLQHLLGLPGSPRAVFRLSTGLESGSEESAENAAARLRAFAGPFAAYLTYPPSGG